MTNYPDAANFLNPMPAWPVNVSCEAFAKWVKPTEEEMAPIAGQTKLTDRQIEVFTSLRDAVNVYFNYDSRPGYCMDGKDTGATGNLDGDGWNVLQCNQLAMPNSTGTNSMFWPETFIEADFNAACLE